MECGHTASYYYLGKNSALAFGTAVPFALTDQQQYAWLYEDGCLEAIDRLYSDFGVRSFPAGNTGAKMGGWFNRPLQGLAFLQGLKMRIPGLGGKVMAALGVNVQVLPGGEIFLALDRGAIDAAEWTGPYDDEKLGLNKAARYYYYPGWWEPGHVRRRQPGGQRVDAQPLRRPQRHGSATADQRRHPIEVLRRTHPPGGPRGHRSDPGRQRRRCHLQGRVRAMADLPPRRLCLESGEWVFLRPLRLRRGQGGAIRGWLSWAERIDALNPLAARLAVGRNLSSNALIEGQWHLFDLMVLLALGYALQTDDHVRVGCAAKPLESTAAGAGGADDLGGAHPALLAAMGGVPRSGRPAALLGQEPEIPLGFRLLGLQGVAQAIRLLHGRPLTSHDHGGEA